VFIKKKAAFNILFVLGLILLLGHSLHYAFLTDDAFISFRYARNLGEGHGLVFNPGGERVEGYTNPLWVLILAFFMKIGFAPDQMAHILTLACTVLLWTLVARFIARISPESGPEWAIPLPLFFLAVTRSFAVWSTSGLETRLFELLIFAGVFRLIVELGVEGEKTKRWPLAGPILALAALTRPDGILIAASILGTAGLWALKTKSLRIRNLVVQATFFAVPVAAHFLFRCLYYGGWLPNTYYAKAAGQMWWGMGIKYVLCFTLEYAAWLWLPLLVLAWFHHRRNGTMLIPLLFGAVIIPHLLYVVSIGGDHFEYRPLDLYLPFIFLLLADGLREWAVRGIRRGWAAAYAAAIVFGLVWLPLGTHVQYPDRFEPGFPGLQASSSRADRFMDPRRDPVYRLPGLRSIGTTYQHLLKETTRHLVGFRQEGHKLFLGSLQSDSLALQRLKKEGLLPLDVHMALSSVGAIPYATDVKTLDRLGLTDAGVAHAAMPKGAHFIGHGKVATLDYAASRGVDLWAVDQAHPILSVRTRRLIRALWSSIGSETLIYGALVGEGEYLLVQFPQGAEKTMARFPGLDFRPVADPAVRDRIAAEAVETLRREKSSDSEARSALASWLALTGRLEDAVEAQEEVVAIDPDDVDTLFDYHALLLRAGAGERAGEVEARIRTLVKSRNSPAFIKAVEDLFRRAGK
jgi:hypothetical protein